MSWELHFCIISISYFLGFATAFIMKFFFMGKEDDTDGIKKDTL